MSLEGLWTPYNLTYNTLMSIQNPGNEKFQEGVTRVLISFNAFLASVSSYLDIFPTNMRDHTGSTFTFKWENHLGRCIVWYVMKYERVFPTMENHLDPVGSILSCQQTLVKSNLDTPFLELVRTRVLDTHYGCQRPPVRSTLFKLRPSV